MYGAQMQKGCIFLSAQRNARCCQIGNERLKTSQVSAIFWIRSFVGYGKGGGSRRAFRQAKENSSGRRITTEFAPVELWIGMIEEAGRDGQRISGRNFPPIPDKKR